MSEMQICRSCHILKPLTHFRRNSRNASGYENRCKECKAKSWAENPGRPRVGRKPYVEPLEKYCKGCLRTLPIDSFAIRTERTNGRRPRCKECASKAHSSWRERNPGSSRSRNLMSKYGISAEDYIRLLLQQDGKCGICGSTESGWKTSPYLHVDHNHESGEIRGLLCHTCNIAVGCVEKAGIDPVILASWIDGVDRLSV